MRQSVLVLNQDYQPLTICTVQRAFLMVYLDKAELINASKTKYLRTVSHKFPLPSVIRIVRYIHIPYRGVVLTRYNIFKRDNFECQYCGTCKDLTLDHVVPRSKGGKSTWKNLVTACKSCNARKGDFNLKEIGMNLKRPPFKPSYVMFLRDNNGLVQKDWLEYLEPASA